MQSIRLFSFAAVALLLATSCEKSQSDAASRLAELERKASESLARQRELEQQLEDQRLAAERDAIEQERMRIEEARAALEQQQAANAAAETEALRQREEELARREGRVQQTELTLQQQTETLDQRKTELSTRERELAGREALATNGNDDLRSMPVADYGMFYDSLSAYGSWFETPDYGYVWQPVIVRDVSWRPYTRGRWVCTDYGWTWLSDEPFGWATYHYGRWALLRGYGWVWVPGCEWAPSWVSWRSSGSHIGWAPLPPESLAYRGRNWGTTVDVIFGINALWFNFVEVRYFGNPIHRHCVPYRQNHDYYHQTVNITNITVHNHRIVSGGPRYDELRLKTGGNLPFYRLDMDRHSRPGRDSLAMRPRIGDGTLSIAAPDIDVAWNEGLKPEKVKRRLENISVERSEPLQAEVVEQFRRSRQQERIRAEQAITELGGTAAFKERRLEKLESNRRQSAEQNRQKVKPSGNSQQATTPAKSKNQAPDENRRQALERVQQHAETERPTRPDAAFGEGAATRTNEQEQSQQQPVEEARRQKPGREAKDADARREAEDQSRRNEAARRRRQLEESRHPPTPLTKPQAEATPGTATENPSLRQQQTGRDDERDSSRQQQEQARQQQLEATRQRQEQTRRLQIEEARQQQEHARQQRLEATRQRQEQTRRLQIEEARQQQEHARQQQLEAKRQQQEQARRLQIEEARQQQEQARQQQLEATRQQQEQARQQQIEKSNREIERRQQPLRLKQPDQAPSGQDSESSKQEGRKGFRER